MATIVQLVAQHTFSDTDAVFVRMEYDSVSLVVAAIIIDNEFGHTIVATVTGPTGQTFTRSFSTPGLGQRIPVAGLTLTHRPSPKGVDFVWFPVGWSLRTDVT